MRLIVTYDRPERRREVSAHKVGIVATAVGGLSGPPLLAKRAHNGKQRLRVCDLCHSQTELACALQLVLAARCEGCVRVCVCVCVIPHLNATIDTGNTIRRRATKHSVEVVEPCARSGPVASQAVASCGADLDRGMVLSGAHRSLRHIPQSSRDRTCVPMLGDYRRGQERDEGVATVLK